MTPTSPNLPEPATCEDCLTVVAPFPPRILAMIQDAASREYIKDAEGNPCYGPMEDGNGEPLQDDADAALRWLSDAQLLAAEVERLRAALTNTRQALEEANDAHSGGPIQDTIWMPAHISKAETLFDYIDAALDASRLALKEKAK